MVKKSPPLAIVERIVRNLPIVGIEYLFTDTPHGRLYIALGKEALENRYHGVWAFTVGPGLAQPMEFKKDQSRKAVIRALEDQGLWMLEEMAKRGMLQEGYFRGR